MTGTITFDGDLSISVGTVLIVELRSASRQDSVSLDIRLIDANNTAFSVLTDGGPIRGVGM